MPKTVSQSMRIPEISYSIYSCHLKKITYKLMSNLFYECLWTISIIYPNSNCLYIDDGGHCEGVPWIIDIGGMLAEVTP